MTSAAKAEVIRLATTTPFQARGGELRAGTRRVVPPIATTDGMHFDRRPAPEERAALLAYLKKL